MHKHPITSIRGRLFALLLGSLSALVFVSGMGMASLRTESTAMDRMYHDQVVPLRLLKILTESYGTLVQTTVVRLNAGELTTKEGLAIIGGVRDSITSCWRQYKGTRHGAEELAVMRQTEEAMRSADMEIENIYRFLEIMEGQGNGLLANRLEPMIGGLDPTVRPVVACLDSLGKQHLETARASYSQAQQRSSGLLWAMAVVSLLAVLLGVVFGSKTLRLISLQLSNILRVLALVGQGNLKERLSLVASNELDEIAEGVNDMIDALKKMLLHIENGCLAMEAASREVHEISEQVKELSRDNSGSSKQAALQAKDAATRLEHFIGQLEDVDKGMASLVESMDGRFAHLNADDRYGILAHFVQSNLKPIHGVKDGLLQLRNENLVGLVNSVASARSSATLSSRGLAHALQRISVLEAQSVRLSGLLRSFDVVR